MTFRFEPATLSASAGGRDTKNGGSPPIYNPEGKGSPPIYNPSGRPQVPGGYDFEQMRKKRMMNQGGVGGGTNTLPGATFSRLGAPSPSPGGGKPGGGGGILNLLSGGDQNFLPRLLQSLGL